MNADLIKAHLEVQAYFLEAQINGNVVEFTATELTTEDIINLGHIHRKSPNIYPWVFRSDKEVKVVAFVKDENGHYIEDETPKNNSHDELHPLLPDNVNSRRMDQDARLISESSRDKKPWSFCEKENSDCTMNHCDENGCQERKRNLVEGKHHGNLKEEIHEICMRLNAGQIVVTEAEEHIYSLF